MDTNRVEKWITERHIPNGYKPVWPSDPKATHAICGCDRHELVLKDADSHNCVWLYLIKEE